MQCEPAEASISEWLDGELSVSRRLAVEAHIAACPSCRRKQRLMAATRDTFRDLGADPAPADFEHRLRDRLAEEQLPATVHRGARRWLPAFALAAAAAIASLALSLFSPEERPANRPAAPSPRWQTPDRAFQQSELLWPPSGGTAVPPCGLAASVECRPVLPCSTAADCSPPLGAVGVALMSM